MFITHTGDRVTGIRLVKARQKVSDDLIKLAWDIYKEDCYAPHVTKEQKQKNLVDGIERGLAVTLGTSRYFTVNQRINYILTGECVALLPK